MCCVKRRRTWESALIKFFKIMGNLIHGGIIFAQNGSHNNILLLLVGSFCPAAVISFELCTVYTASTYTQCM